MDVVPDVHRVARAGTNLYVIEGDDGVTIVDAGLPKMWDETTRLLHAVGRTWADVSGFVLTHGHFDHLGILARAVAEHGTPVYAHPGDHRIVRHPYRYRPGRPRVIYPLRHPRSILHLTRMVIAGALRVQGVEVSGSFEGGETLDLPGRPVIVATPGHTDGHCAVHVPSFDIVFTGDTLVTLDPYTGRTGPRVVAQGGTHEASRALASLDVLGAIDATFVAPGHGELWVNGIAAAATSAQGAGLP